MDIDSLASEFGSAKKSNTEKPSGLDVDSLVSEFGSGKTKPKTETETGVKKVYITGPRVPISGAESPNDFQIDPTLARPYPKSTSISNNDIENAPAQFMEWASKLPSSFSKTSGEATLAGKDLMSEGINDIGKGNLGKGVLKTIGGGVSQFFATPGAAITELVEKPVTTFTGNPDIGKRADFVVNAALPIIPTTKSISAAIPKNKAFSSLVESIGPENAGKVAQRMRENPRLAPADLSPAVKADTQGLFVTPGSHINYLSDAAGGRVATAKQAVEAAANQNLGHTVNVLDKLDALKASAQKVGREQINPAIVGAKPVDVSPVIAKIDAQLKPGISSVISSGQLPDIGAKKQLAELRKILTDGKSQRISAAELHEFQSVLRAKAEDLISSANGSERQLGHSLMNVRNGIVDSIDAAASGKYKPALANYRDEMHIGEAFHHGHDSIITNGKKIETRPEFFEKWVKDATDAEREAAREGARLAIDTQINGFQHGARKGTDIGEVEFNKQKIRALFGKEEADKLFTKLKDERAIADTNSKVVQGSQTEMRASAKEKFKLPEPSEVGKGAMIMAGSELASAMANSGLPGAASAAYLALKAGHKVKDVLQSALKKKHNEEYAKFALPSTGPDREELIKGLEAVAARNAPKLSPSSLARLVAP